MTHHSIADAPPPVGVAVFVWWWGENRDIVATWDGARWRDEQGRLVRGPVLYWRVKCRLLLHLCPQEPPAVVGVGLITPHAVHVATFGRVCVVSPAHTGQPLQRNTSGV
jgi:hypothetical protein